MQKYTRRKLYKNIGASKKLGIYKNIGTFKIFGGCQNLGTSKIFGGKPKPWSTKNLWHLQKCCRTGKTSCLPMLAQQEK
jgi:hypothetical protein